MDSYVSEGATIRAYSHLEGARVGAEASVGPYARLREGSVLERRVKVGNFVEIKKTQVGDKSNVAHLTYLGDATLGQEVNVGAGTITANYDGYRKHQTIIGDRTKTGANSVFVAPVTLGEEVTVAAGSVVTNDVPDHALVIARQRQRIIEDWKAKMAQKKS